MADLEPQLRAAREAGRPDPPLGDTAPVGDPPDGRESIVRYVAGHPGVLSRDVVVYGRGAMTHREAKALITELLSSGQLVSDRPGERVFGGAHQRLWAAGGASHAER